MNKNVFFQILISIISTIHCWTQTVHDNYLIVSYDQVIELAQNQSPQAMARRIEKESSYWTYQSFKANYRPQLLLNANLPGLTQGYNLIAQPDGSQSTHNIFQSQSTTSLLMNQRFGKTGGELSLHSNLSHFDSYIDTLAHQLQSTPIGISYTQPIFQYNQDKLDQKLKEMQYDESLKNYIYELEEISITATNMFFGLMVAQIQRDIAEINMLNNDTIFKIANGRYELGKIAENEYLQIELQYLTSQQNFKQAEIDIKNASLALKNFLGIKDDRDLVLLLPETIPTINVDPVLALKKARAHRPEMLAFERQRIEAEEGVKKAKANSGFNADLSISYGLSSASNNIIDIYNDREKSQMASVQLSVPILDWGRSNAERKLAEANLEMVRYNLDQQLVNFEQEIYTHVSYYLQTSDQIDMAKKTDLIAQKRYDIAKKRFMIGKITITDINIATQEKDQSKITYINSLMNYWIAHYTLRKLTMYDFLYQKDLIPIDDQSN